MIIYLLLFKYTGPYTFNGTRGDGVTAMTYVSVKS